MGSVESNLSSLFSMKLEKGAFRFVFCLGTADTSAIAEEQSQGKHKETEREGVRSEGKREGVRERGKE